MRLKLVLIAGLILLIAWTVGNYFLQNKPAPVPPSQRSAEIVTLPKPRLAVYSDRECLARNLAFETLGNSHSREWIGALLARQEMEAIARVVFQRKELGKRVGYRDIGRKLTGALLTISAPITRTSAKNPPNGLKKIRMKWRSMETTPSPAQKKQLLRPGKHRAAFLFEYLHNTKGIA